MATSVEYNLGPNTYPRGWFIVAESKELDEGPMGFVKPPIAFLARSECPAMIGIAL